MKLWNQKIPAALAMWSCALRCGMAADNQPVDAAIQGVQQAPDPSAAVAAYAYGFAIDRNNPNLYEAYVARMVDLGLPEMAYHQAEILTSLQANNGLAWGVIAYVDARRAQMPEAISAINLAGQFAPDNQFVQHTAGELVAWYDLKADKATLPDNVKGGLTKVRGLLNQQPAFTEAYSTAQKAYQTQASLSSQPAQGAPTQAAPTQTAPPQQAAPSVPNAPQVPMAPQAQADLVAPPGYAPSVAAPAYYQDYPSPYYYPDYSGAYLDWAPDYCYGWGPGWVAPAPWCWWQPCGFWGGCDFFPFGVSFAFGDFGDFGHFHHDGFFDHDGRLGHERDSAFWHHDPQGRNSFFGTPARPASSVAQWARAGSPASSASASKASGASATWWNGTGQHNSLATVGARAGSAQLSIPANHGGLASPSPSSLLTSGSPATRGNLAVAPSTVGRSSIVARSPTTTVPVARSAIGSSSAYQAAPATRGTSAGQNSYARSYAAPSSGWAVPNYRAPVYAAPRYAVPSGGSFGGYGGSRAPMTSVPRSFGGSSGGVRGGSSFSGGSRSGGFSGGGIHSGGFSGGGHGGGGHR